jgi:hypothetical protein
MRHHTKINHFLCTGIAKAALVGWRHMVQVFVAGFRNGELQILLNHQFDYTDALSKNIT